jgi:hypothetical protein
MCETQAMNEHLACIAKAVAPGAHAALILGGAGWHESQDLVMPESAHGELVEPRAASLIGGCWWRRRASRSSSKGQVHL